MISASRKPYDYFQAMELLRTSAHTMSMDERRRLKAIVALNASDADAAALYVDINGDDWANIYPPTPKPEPITTGNAIDKFLETYGRTSPQEDELLEKLIFNPVPEYSGILAKESGHENAENMARLAKEINEPSTGTKLPEEVAPVVKQKEEETSAKQTPNTPLTLELAKIFVKQGRFDRAHDIISKIILNNPEKSVYFADQMRFLEKLMKIQQISAQKNKPTTNN